MILRRLRLLPKSVVPPSRFVATIPPALDDLVIAMMAKRPDDRPASYAELRAIR